MTNIINTFLNNSIGFDKFFDDFSIDHLPRSGFPFYNIKRISEDKYQIEMALAGFDKDEINVHQTDEVLTIEASEKIKDTKKPEDEKGHFISKNISKRYFKRQFQLADTVEVKKVRNKNGMLYIDLENNRPKKEKTFDID